MITEPTAIQKLALRSDLPRLKREGFYLFAQLEGDEQQLAARDKAALVAQAFAALVAHEERNAERPLPTVVPRGYRQRELATDWLELELACDLAEPYERRNRAGNVLAVTRYLRGRVRLFHGAFAYFTPDDLAPLESLDTAGFAPLA